MGRALTIRKTIVSKLATKFGRDGNEKARAETHGVEADPIYHSDGIPTADQCRVHLKLMKVFAHLREDICGRDGLYGLFDATVNGSKDQAATPEDTEASYVWLREQRWQSYVIRSTARFEHWWKSFYPGYRVCKSQLVDVQVCNVENGIEKLLKTTPAMQWSEHNLPPVDVLMALHSFMLNPRCFLEDCILFEMLPLWKAGIPWALLDQVIHDGVYEYEPPEAARRTWSQHAQGRPWDSTDDFDMQSLACPTCDEPIVYNCFVSPLVLWTGIPEQSNGLAFSNIDSEVQCPSNTCGASVSPDLFAVRKMRRSIQGCGLYPAPLQGALLTSKGLAKSLSVNGAAVLRDLICSNPLRNNLMSYLESKEAALSERHAKAGNGSTSDQDNQELASLTSIRADMKRMIEEQLQQGFTPLTPRQSPSHGVAIDKTQVLNATSRWLESTSHPSIFSLDLASAIIRQGSFINTMHTLSWLYSPALDMTLSRILLKYPTFIEIIARYPAHVAVPTHAIDLAWHTHQLSPASYYKCTVEVTGTHRRSDSGFPCTAEAEFIDHDDKISDTLRDGAFEWTGQTYESISDGEKYSECLCWECMARAQFVASRTNAAKTKTKVDMSLDDQAREEPSVAVAKALFYKLEDDYARTVRHAKKDGKANVKQEDFLKTYQWLYPDSKPSVVTN